MHMMLCSSFSDSNTRGVTLCAQTDPIPAWAHATSVDPGVHGEAPQLKREVSNDVWDPRGSERMRAVSPAATDRWAPGVGTTARVKRSWRLGPVCSEARTRASWATQRDH